ncbi:DUF222 domain-containing protein [Nocardioides agariphilus]|jgi:hypothetical protein|uniref:DUF222 domain-containing protein n=1 Tax=Nocardioides agariphilus TaxID=433664 RepID=A0A930VLZ2_9ACTN|nr:HNH endonuclease signature motif containing protein [Nocardioides agariphilus]MBF4768031.1 DUF222 domain-containing protein [Nocardioides agariphilus]
MSSTYAEPFARIAEALDEIAAINPVFRSTTEKQDLLTGLAGLIARAQAQQLRVLAVADDVAEQTGARSTAAWLADETRDAHGRIRADARLADLLDQRWTLLGDAFAKGRVNLAQVRAISDALSSLPQDLGDDLLAKAEDFLVDQAAQLGPRELANLGRGVLQHVAPDIADQAEYQALLAAEDRASAATRLTMRRRGDGSTDGSFRIPDALAGRVRTYLHAYLSPRRRRLDTPFGPVEDSTPDEFGDLPIARRQGIAFAALLENIPTDTLPRHGGTATSVVIAVDYDDLVAEVQAAGVVETSSGDVITGGELRRLACNAGILPAVMGGKSEVLDAGREQRLVKGAMRKLMNVRDKTCTTMGCTVPAAFCDAHHPKPWSQGGRTSLKDCKLLCLFHHRRAHHPDWLTHHHPNGKTSFTRRQ